MKTFKLTGHALVPVEVEMEVTAETAQEALVNGLAKFRENPSTYVVANSQDEMCAHDWQPFLEEIK